MYSKQARRTLAGQLVNEFNSNDWQQQQEQQQHVAAEVNEYLTEDKGMRVASAAHDKLDN